MGSQLCKYNEGSPGTWSPAYLMFKNFNPFLCAFLTKWTNLTKGSLEYHYRELLKSLSLVSLKLNWIIIAQKFPELSGMLISNSNLRFFNLIRNLRLSLCKTLF